MTTVASAPAPSFAPMHDQMGRARSRSPVKSTPSSPELRRTPSSSSLSSVHQHHTHTPSAADLKPNAHPYPIATTATGVLSRSNSLSSSPNQTRHHYVPPSPSAGRREREDANASNNDNGERLGERGEGEGHKKKKEERRAEYRGHRYSRSLSSSEDMYTFLPSPSSASTHGASGSPGPRALPVPPGVSANSIAAKSAAASGSYGSYALSPKRWTPAQLAAHLDRTVSPEAGAWAADRGVGGKAFMRLGEMGEEELVGMGAPASLRPAARALRQEVLQGQLGSSSPKSSASEGSDDGWLRSESPTRIGNASPNRGRPSVVREEGEEAGEDVGGEGEDGTPSHRRRTMSVPSPFSSPFAPRAGLNRAYSNNSYANNNNNNMKDDVNRAYTVTHPPSPPSPSPSMGGRFRNGRVRGMVREFESSGSESGEGSPERGGSGFRSGSGFRAHGNGNGSGFRGGQSDAEEDEVHGTVKQQAHGHKRALPVRPDGMGMGIGMGDEVDLGATVRAYDGNRNGAANGTAAARAYSSPRPDSTEDELTVEELLAREDAMGAPPASVLSPNNTGGGGWRMSRRVGQQLTGQRTGGSEALVQQMSGNGGAGRPLPAQPPHRMDRSGSGGVHAWEADDGAVGATVKRVPTGPTKSVHPRLSESELISEKEREEKEREAKRVQMEAEAEAQERGRLRGEAVRAQLAEVTDLRALVDTFRTRLEEVERRVGAMEGASSSAPAKKQVAATTTITTAPMTVTQRLDPRRLLALFAPPPAQTVNKIKNKGLGDEREEWVGPTTLAALPSYMLLVGLGMCAVVLRVLVRRAARGRGAA